MCYTRKLYAILISILIFTLVSTKAEADKQTQIVGLGTGAISSLLFNWTPNRFINLRAGILRMQNKLGDARILIEGDSTTQGYGCNAGHVNEHACSFPTAMIPILQSMGIPAKNTSLTFSNVFPLSSYTTYDSRVSGSGFIPSQGQATYGGMLAGNNGAAGQVLTLTQSAPFDKIDIYYVRNSGGSTFTVDVDGGAAAFTSSNGSQAYLKQTITVARGTHVINVTSIGVGVNICAILPYDSQNPAIEIINNGMGGQTEQYFVTATNVWSPSNSAAISTFKPDLDIIELTINAARNSETVASYITNMQTIISARLAQNIDVVLSTGTPFSGATTPAQVAFVNAVYQLAIANNLPVIDLYNFRYISYSFTNPIIPYFDAIHFTTNGYQDKAVAYSLALQQIISGFGIGGTGSGAQQTIDYQPGLLTSVNSTIGVYNTFVKSSTVDNIVGSAVTFSCVANPTITLYECGTSSTCSSPTTIGTVTVTAAGTKFNGTVSNAAVTSGDSIGWAMTAGTCASIDISVTAQVHTN